MPNVLQTRRILVTRPTHQAHALSERLRAAGAEPVLFPVITIEAICNTLPECATQLCPDDIIIFVSANAVAHGLTRLEPLAPGLRIVAVGAATARTLYEYGVQEVLQPRDFSSEGLLELPSFQRPQIFGQRVLIVRGEGGRETLAGILRERGAQVHYAEVYRRIRPQFNIDDYAWATSGEIDAILISSGEGLDNLRDMLHDPAWLYEIPLVVISPRLAELAVAQGWRSVITARRADDEGLFKALQQVNYE